ncbi:hypothetical protein HIM_12485 [Hirsutella minnesotensis 3608]|uniref:Uncharacterized protein n=1 Tax=Hirsutella minnesotensis 3608 TaxID=1043627 RepID=A0A0F8A015_9HYPO|nr:hypothetical protein HIM_12485 [Hirsutella minnesotensis 3608]
MRSLAPPAVVLAPRCGLLGNSYPCSTPLYLEFAKLPPPEPKENVKLLGVIMDQALRFKEHIAGVAAKGLTAAMCLKRLKMASPRTARQLFIATVAPTMDYASNVWSHACKTKEATWIERAQRVGAQAVTGGFRTVATAVAEAEASVQSFRERHAQAAAKFWIRMRTLPNSHPLTSVRFKLHRRYASPVLTTGITTPPI